MICCTIILVSFDSYVVFCLFVVVDLIEIYNLFFSFQSQTQRTAWILTIFKRQGRHRRRMSGYIDAWYMMREGDKTCRFLSGGNGRSASKIPGIVRTTWSGMQSVSQVLKANSLIVNSIWTSMNSLNSAVVISREGKRREMQRSAIRPHVLGKGPPPAIALRPGLCGVVTRGWINGGHSAAPRFFHVFFFPFRIAFS